MRLYDAGPNGSGSAFQLGCHLRPINFRFAYCPRPRRVHFSCAKSHVSCVACAGPRGDWTQPHNLITAPRGTFLLLAIPVPVGFSGLLWPTAASHRRGDIPFGEECLGHCLATRYASTCQKLSALRLPGERQLYLADLYQKCQAAWVVIVGCNKTGRGPPVGIRPPAVVGQQSTRALLRDGKDGIAFHNRPVR